MNHCASGSTGADAFSHTATADGASFSGKQNATPGPDSADSTACAETVLPACALSSACASALPSCSNAVSSAAKSYCALIRPASFRTVMAMGCAAPCTSLRTASPV